MKVGPAHSNPIAKPRPTPPAPNARVDAAEIGLEKSPTQHLGNLAFGLASTTTVASHVKKLLRISSKSRLSPVVPLLHLGVVVLESYNSAHKLNANEKVVAATSGGNAVGCLSALFDSSAGLAGLNQKLGLGAALGAVGGALGIGAGVAELRQGLKNKQAGGSSRTFNMGLLDVSGGVTSLTGAALCAVGHGTAGTSLLLTASLIDLAGIGADYLGSASSRATSSGSSTAPG